MEEELLNLTGKSSSSGIDFSFISMFLNADLVVKIVVVLLILLSYI